MRQTSSSIANSKDTPTKSSDWFLSAIQTEGSVGDSLKTVLAELSTKHQFISALIQSIAEKRHAASDSVTEISQRVRVLENTLKFRLALLSPDRKGAWFRSSTATTGPFKESLLPEPVFSTHDEKQHGRIRKSLEQCWVSRSLLDFPFKASESTLWKTLLTLNFELEKIDLLPPPFPRLTLLPDQLNPELESRSLRAFLINVRVEILSIRSRLADSYRILLDASDRYWRHHATSSSQRGSSKASSQEPVSGGDFKSRRATTGSGRFSSKSASDFEALKFMGFQEYPSGDELKQRYHALALEMHPDRPSGTEERFTMLNKSYKYLMSRCVR